jgi:thiopeptide-type bacteriocin biosynthesis protein
MAVLDAVATGWLSFHLFQEDGGETFLTSALPGFLATEATRRSFQRFFFVRYSEGGHHLRLRFRTDHRSEGLAERLEDCVREHSAAPFRLQITPYDRTAHYFGETPASVYAELLNESTSRLALRLLGSPVGQPRLRRWLVLTATLDLLLEALASSGHEKRARIAASLAFAERTAESLFGPEAAVPLEESRQGAYRWPALLGPVRARLDVNVDKDGDLPRLGALMRRADRRHDFVNVHALHLLCNKLGFSLFEEHAAYAALIHLATTEGRA